MKVEPGLLDIIVVKIKRIVILVSTIILLLLTSCSSNSTKTYDFYNDEIIESNNDLLLKTNNQTSNSKKIELLIRPIKTYGIKINNSDLYIKDYQQNVIFKIYRQIYVGDKKRLFEPVMEEEIYSNNCQLAFFNTNSSDNIYLYDEEITNKQLYENYIDYGTYGTIQYYVVIEPTTNEKIVLNSNDLEISKCFYYDKLEYMVSIDYILDDSGNITFVKGISKTLV